MRSEVYISQELSSSCSPGAGEGFASSWINALRDWEIVRFGLTLAFVRSALALPAFVAARWETHWHESRTPCIRAWHHLVEGSKVGICRWYENSTGTVRPRSVSQLGLRGPKPQKKRLTRQAKTFFIADNAGTDVLACWLSVLPW